MSKDDNGVSRKALSPHILLYGMLFHSLGIQEDEITRISDCQNEENFDNTCYENPNKSPLNQFHGILGLDTFENIHCMVWLQVKNDSFLDYSRRLHWKRKCQGLGTV
ncbi:unnamed protein product [Lepeophtheirus salmonis]|uniref:(salmon louse) hypothetical protein n=1 Tax=Lepeophtheirus salmonis TaxID=72036 RepID=A0A7R8HC31_LEPSM|nr:unnamed protein product [Lepeophtheirus salmonis]CAF2998908.1 unnamed protein product [Lepeophtheirus salmonis]